MTSGCSLDKQDEDVLEAQRLRASAGLSDSGIGKTVVARVIGRDPTQSIKRSRSTKACRTAFKPTAP